MLDTITVGNVVMYNERIYFLTQMQVRNIRRNLYVQIIEKSAHESECWHRQLLWDNRVILK